MTEFNLSTTQNNLFPVRPATHTAAIAHLPPFYIVLAALISDKLRCLKSKTFHPLQLPTPVSDRSQPQEFAVCAITACARRFWIFGLSSFTPAQNHNGNQRLGSVVPQTVGSVGLTALSSSMSEAPSELLLNDVTAPVGTVFSHFTAGGQCAVWSYQHCCEQQSSSHQGHRSWCAMQGPQVLHHGPAGVLQGRRRSCWSALCQGA